MGGATGIWRRRLIVLRPGVLQWYERTQRGVERPNGAFYITSRSEVHFTGAGVVSLFSGDGARLHLRGKTSEMSSRYDAIDAEISRLGVSGESSHCHFVGHFGLDLNFFPELLH